MKDFTDDFFEAAIEEAEAPEIETPEVDAPAVEIEETATVETPEEPKTEEAESEKAQEPTMVPVSALAEQRRLAREYRENAERLNAELAQLRAAQIQAQPVVQQPQHQTLDLSIPDPIEDPAAYHNYVLAQARQEFRIENVKLSRARAVETHGLDEVNAAADWASEQARINPAFEETVLSQPDPAAWVIAQMKRSALLKNFENDPDAYVRARALELGLTATPAPVQIAVTQPATKDTGPTSLVNAKSRNENVSPLQQAKDDFDAIFRK